MCFLLLSVQIGVIATIFLYAGTWLSSPASRPEKADLVAILGGGTGDRLKKGAELYTSGLAKRVLITGFSGSKLGIEPLHTEWRYHYLLQFDIPENDIIKNSTARSTWQEARLIRSLLQDLRGSRVLVVSDPPHLRRLSWTFAQVFSGSGLEYRLISSEPEWWSARLWWSKSSSAQFVISELIKIMYYRVEYNAEP